MNLIKLLTDSSCYDKYLCIEDFNSETSETALRDAMRLH